MSERGRLKLFGVMAALLVLVLIICAFCLGKQPQRISFVLPDQTRIELIEAETGTNQLFFHHVLSWDRILSSLGTHPVQRYRAYPERFTLPYTNGGFGIELRHDNAGAPLDRPINGTEKLVQLTSSGAEVSGVRMRVIFGTGKFRSLKVTREDIYWLFPRSAERDIRLRYYVTNAANHVVLTNNFSIPGSAFK